MTNYQVDWKYKPFLFLIDLTGNILFFYKKLNKKRFKKEEINKILIIRIDEIGDVILTTPLISALKKEFPKAKICVLVKKSTETLLKNNPNVDKIYFTKSWFKGKVGLGEFVGLIKNLRKENFDIVFDPHADPRNIILAYFVGKMSVGFEIRGFGFLLDFIAPYKNKHIIETINDLGKAIGIKEISKKTEVYFSTKDKEMVNKMLKKEGVKTNTILICINPGTGRKNKEWQLEKWRMLVRLLLKKYDCRIIFTGNSEERELINSIMKGFDNCHNFAGKTNLSELTALIQKCSLFLAPDTGSLHIARALNVPLIGLFGPVDPAIWGYKEKKYASIYKRMACSFCNMPKCSSGEKCMKEIGVREVYSKIKSLLK